MAKKPLEIDMIAGSQIRDSQGEMLSVEGADISELEAGNGRLNDNHGKGFFNSIGRVTLAKKIFTKDDCTDDRQKYYWEKVKSPYIYVRGELYDDEDHPNARAAAAILRNIHKSDTPLKIRASVEGGVVSRGLKDPSMLARTKIHSVAVTFTPANNATLVEPLNLSKGNYNEEEDMALIKSVTHLAVSDVPSFRQIERRSSAAKIKENFVKIQELAKSIGISIETPEFDPNELAHKALEKKIASNVGKINELVKALTAGYGGGGMSTNSTGGGVLQSESLEGQPGRIKKKEFDYVTCDNCGKEQIHMRQQLKCRNCNKAFSMEKIAKLIT